ncbi:hypothetical protein [Actinomadura sp. B10D3]|uniref:hypothetical protein n=1 Tax=Actinomadura sp. B10D3 TaxID=3153557 RepID=UPI00325DA707
MELRDATRMILTESAGYPELLRVSRDAHERSARPSGSRAPATFRSPDPLTAPVTGVSCAF